MEFVRRHQNNFALLEEASIPKKETKFRLRTQLKSWCDWPKMVNPKWQQTVTKTVYLLFLLTTLLWFCNSMWVVKSLDKVGYELKIFSTVPAGEAVTTYPVKTAWLPLRWNAIGHLRHGGSFNIFPTQNWTYSSLRVWYTHILLKSVQSANWFGQSS